MTTINVKNYEHYVIFEDGVLINCKTEKQDGDILEGWITETGYRRVNLTSNNKSKMFYVHRLLALTFIPNPLGLPEVDHIDRNRLNNSLDNLHWVTALENMNNKSKPKSNTSGELGVFKRRGNWCYARVIHGVKHHKQFATKVEAIIYKKQFLENLNLEYI